MYESSLLTPTVLTGIIQKYTAPPGNVGRGLFRTKGYAFSQAVWDVVQGTRYRSDPIYPNREARLVGQHGVGQKTASFIYMREKKAFEPTTLRWLRSPGNLAKSNAEAAVRRELADLNERLERFVESTIWEALTGTITVVYPDAPNVSIDLGFDASHKVTASVKWDHTDASGNYDADVIGDVKTWGRLIAKDSGIRATDIYLQSTVMDYVFKNHKIQSLLSDRKKDEYLNTGEIHGLVGMNWHVYDNGYVNSSDVFVPYVPDKKIIMLGKRNDNFELLEGPSADFDAPDGLTGKFSKSWQTKDPSARFVLVEYHFLPTIKYPDTVVLGTVLT